MLPALAPQNFDGDFAEVGKRLRFCSAMTRKEHVYDNYIISVFGNCKAYPSPAPSGFCYAKPTSLPEGGCGESRFSASAGRVLAAPDGNW